MDFQEFLQIVPKLIAAELPATQSHLKMAPLERLNDLKNQLRDNYNPRTAAFNRKIYNTN